MGVAQAIVALAVALTVSTGAVAAECGPDKLGVSRVQKVGTHGGLEVGWKSYRETIPLADHEVILTFDDGPDPKYTPMVLDALKDQCVRATFFAIGRNADATPALMRREVAEGHNVAFHTYTHPQPTLRYMSDADARADILKGMIAVERAAYGASYANGSPDDLSQMKLHAPFFRFPGFADTPDLRGWFAKNNVAIFGVDLWASDWVKMTPEEELKLILSRLEHARKGMILLHDNKPWTAEMLPSFLAELKTRGYHIVQIEPGPDHGPTEAAPAAWTSQTERTLTSLKPKLEKAAAKAKAPIEVKPAPLE
jgi:peptidoglycan/xylan/chitin deacetylase (PgdA/CDA1 family)